MLRPRRVALALSLAVALSATVPPVHADRAGEVRVRAFRLVNEGVAAYKRGEHAEAVEKLREASSLALNSFRAYYYLGLALNGDRRYSEGLQALAVALDLNPTHLHSHVATGDAHLKLGDLDEARAAYFRALKVRAEHAAALDGIARVYEAEDKIDLAIQTFRRAIASDSGFAPAYTHLGDLFLWRDRFEEAVQLLEEAVSVRPDFAAGMNRLALAYGRLGLRNLAVATIRRAMELEPNNASHPAALGVLQLDEGFLAIAEDWFNQSLDLDPFQPMARVGLSEVARRRGDYELALQQLDAGLADERMDSVARGALERTREKLVLEQARVAELEASVTGWTATPEESGELARIYADRGRWARAIELQRYAGDSPETLETLAFMLFRADRFREAQELYAELSAAGGRADLVINDGVSFARLGDDVAAVAAYRQALALDPTSWKARLYLGNALLRLGQREEAIEAYRQFLGVGEDGEAAERIRRILRQIAPQALPDFEPALSGAGDEGS